MISVKFYMDWDFFFPRWNESNKMVPKNPKHKKKIIGGFFVCNQSDHRIKVIVDLFLHWILFFYDLVVVCMSEVRKTVRLFKMFPKSSEFQIDREKNCFKLIHFHSMHSQIHRVSSLGFILMCEIVWICVLLILILMWLWCISTILQTMRIVWLRIKVEIA